MFDPFAIVRFAICEKYKELREGNKFFCAFVLLFSACTKH